MITACIVNFNEEKKLKNCLESITDFASEIVVIDLGSTDNSKEVVKGFKGKFFDHENVSYVELVRNYAVALATGEWILVLDPDEEVSASLKNKLKDIAKQDKFAAVNIPRKNIFFGKWIAHTNFWPDRHVRFFKKGKVKWEDRIHRYPKVDGNVFDLPAKEDLAIIHFGYDSIAQFIDRQNRYSTVEADNLYRERMRFSWKLFFWKPTREFLVRFIRHMGFLDGFYGFALTYLMVVYQLQVMIKLWELEKKQ